MGQQKPATSKISTSMYAAQFKQNFLMRIKLDKSTDKFKFVTQPNNTEFVAIIVEKSKQSSAANRNKYTYCRIMNQVREVLKVAQITLTHSSKCKQIDSFETQSKMQ